ncbi:MAG: hypothetical protein CTY38_00740 [Methylotenera sp.]|uniref:hypothetical protein n=1 Tax=Methylotenera sp. TaxID=2051956 RepID=UPI000D4F87D7|nr:hypothetical protein [Methylotenera sp.]PPC84605.1 MAG: hypothetical protein CTY38_00740 [Methylotenera sp.]
MTQQEFLKDLKENTGLTWDAIAAASGVHARALKTYRMPESSKDYRPMPNVAKVALTSLLK